MYVLVKMAEVDDRSCCRRGRQDTDIPDASAFESVASRLRGSSRLCATSGSMCDNRLDPANELRLAIENGIGSRPYSKASPVKRITKNRRVLIVQDPRMACNLAE